MRGVAAKVREILIIEDDLSIAELQKDYLEVAGFEVSVCTEGLSGLKAAIDGEYDLLILDIMLPGVDGLEILQRLRAVKETPVLLVSAKKEEIDKIKGLSHGANDYITKPFSPGELVARVKAHLENYERLKTKLTESINVEKRKSAEKISIRGLEIDIAARMVWLNQQVITLTQKEFDLLVYLAKHPNRVFGRDELFERIWGLEALGDSSTVTVHIARIREKVEALPANPQYIETVWGAGYRFRI